MKILIFGTINYNKIIFYVYILFIWLVNYLLQILFMNTSMANPLNTTMLNYPITVYFCEFNDGAKGYYDQPCKYIMQTKINAYRLQPINDNLATHYSMKINTNHNYHPNHNPNSNTNLNLHANSNTNTIITEKVLTFKINYQSTPKIQHNQDLKHSINTLKQPSRKIALAENAKLQQLSQRRCHNALQKIPIITKLLAKHQATASTLAPATQIAANNQQAIIKLTRSLARYNKLKQQYCMTSLALSENL